MIVVVCHNSSLLVVVVVTRSIHNESCVIYSYSIYMCVKKKVLTVVVVLQACV